MKENQLKKPIMIIAIIVVAILTLNGISEWILNYSSPKEGVSESGKFESVDNSNITVENHRDDDFIGCSLDTLCIKRNMNLGDDKIYMNDDPDDYSGAYIDCELYFDTLKKYETLYVVRRDMLNDTRKVRKSYEEFVEENFSYYLYTVSDIDIATTLSNHISST